MVIKSNFTITMETMMVYQRKKGSQHIRKAPITTPRVTNALCSFKTVSKSTYFCRLKIQYLSPRRIHASSLFYHWGQKIVDGSVKAAPTFEYTHARRDKDGTSRSHPSVDYDRPKADPIPHTASAALRLASASLVRVFGGSHPDCLQILGALCVLLLKFLFPMQRQFSLQAEEYFL